MLDYIVRGDNIYYDTVFLVQNHTFYSNTKNAPNVEKKNHVQKPQKNLSGTNSIPTLTAKKIPRTTFVATNPVLYHSSVLSVWRLTCTTRKFLLLQLPCESQQ